MALQLLSLSDQEVVHMLGLTSFKMDYDKVKGVVLEWYPRGYHVARRSEAPHWRQGMWAEHDDEGAWEEDQWEGEETYFTEAEPDPEADEAEEWVTSTS